VNPPVVLLDDSTPGQERLLRFSQPKGLISISDPSQLDSAFGQLEAALAGGRHVAGWMSYELGYAIEARLSPKQRKGRNVPLLWFGVFDAPERLSLAELGSAGRAYAGPLRHEWDERAYRGRFAQVHGYIAAGDIYQANLSFRSRLHFTFNCAAARQQRTAPTSTMARARYSACRPNFSSRLLPTGGSPRAR